MIFSLILFNNDTVREKKNVRNTWQDGIFLTNFTLTVIIVAQSNRHLLINQVEHFAEETIMDQGGEETYLRETGTRGTGGVGGAEVQRGSRDHPREQGGRSVARRRYRGCGSGSGSRRGTSCSRWRSSDSTRYESLREILANLKVIVI